MARLISSFNTVLLFRFTVWILLSFVNYNPFDFAHCLSTPKNGGGSRRGSAPSSSPRNVKPRTTTRSRGEVATSNAKIERTIVILYNKPSNIITSHESQDSRITVYEDVLSMKGFLPPSQSIDNNDGPANSLAFEKATGIRSKLHAIGRLDADTTGLLLLTNDGRLVNYVTNPDAKIEDHELYRDPSDDSRTPTGKVVNKTYQALIMGHHTDESLQSIREGVDIGKGYVTKPLLNKDDLKILEHPNHKSTIVSITIGEGKNRQIRKMFHAIGSGVMKLKRTRIGDHLTLDGVNGTS